MKSPAFWSSRIRRSLHTAWVLTIIAAGASGCDRVDGDRSPADRTAPPPVAAAVEVGGAASTARIVFADADGDGEFVAAHDGLTMAVRASGVVSLRPAVGPSLELETSAIRRGGDELSVGATYVAPSAGRLAITRGAATEHVQATPGGLQQTWDFVGKPSGAGDLEIHVAFSGYEHGGAGDFGHRLVDPDTGAAMIYGTATWIEADGERTAVKVEHDAGELVVVVPETLVEQSSYPAVLDPIIGPEVVSNDGRWPAPGDQRNPRVASDGAGRQLIAWVDASGGNQDIRGAFQVSDHGVVTPTSFLLAGGPGDQSQPSVAHDGTDFLLAWNDGVDSGNIRVARVASTGFVAPAGGVLVASGVATQATPTIDCEPGRCLIAWVEYTAADPRIRARFYSVAGGLEGSTFTLTPGASGHFSPELTFAGGQYALAWSDHSTGPWQVRAMRVSTAGTVLDPGGLVLSMGDFNSEPQIHAEADHAVVAWYQADGPSAPRKILARGVSLATAVADPGPHVLEPTEGDHTEPDVGFDGANFPVCWGGDGRLSCRRLDLSGVPIDPPVSLGGPATSPHLRVSIAFGGDDLVATWADDRDPATTRDIYALRIGSGLVRLGDDLLVSSIPADGQKAPALAWGGKSYLVVWQDLRFGSWDIVGVRVHRSGRVLDEEPIVISDAPADQIEPAVAYASDYLVVWADGRNGNFDIYGTRVDPFGGVLDPGGLAISTAVGHQRRPKLDYAGGHYLVAYNDTRNGNPDIYATRVGAGFVLDPLGIPICTLPVAQGAVDVAHGDLWSFVVFEHELIPGTIQLRGTAVGPTGLVHTPNGRSLANSSNVQEEPAVASNGDDEFVVVWEEIGQIRGATLDFEGDYIGGAGRVGVGGFDTEFDPDISYDGERYMVMWRDDAAGADVHGAIIEHAFTITEPEFVVSGSPEDQTLPAVEAAAPGLGLVAFQVDAAANSRTHTRTIGNGCCDETGFSPGCLDFDVQSCVCDHDPYCCTTDWDMLCVEEVEDCGTCSGCTATVTPGTTDPTVEECVCAWDPYCCETQWDGLCVAEITQHACGSC